MSEAREVSRRGSARDRLVEAATRLFWREGYHPVSTDAVCRAAEVRKGSLYHAFPSKADLLAACLEEVWARDWSDLNAIYAGSGTPQDKLRAHLNWFADSQRQLKDQHGIVLGNFHMALGVSLPDLIVETTRTQRAEHNTRVKTSIIDVLELGPADDAHARWLTDVVVELISGTMLRARLNDDLSPLEKLPNTILRLIHAVPLPHAEWN